MMHKFKNLKKHHLGVGFALAVAVILFWRGVWQLADLYIFPEDPAKSNLVSLFLGAGAVYVIYRYLDRDAADRL